jgi:hypothetical protein
MSNSKVYILQKDFPGHKSGTKFLKDPDYDNRYYPEWCFHQKNGKYIWENRIVYGITEADVLDVNWFLPEEDHEVAKAKELLRGMGYYVSLSMVEFEPVSKEFKIKSAKELLEREGYHVYKDPDIGVVNQIIANYKAAGKPYTEEDMIKCFIYAYKAGQIETWVGPDFLQRYAENYLKYLNKR